MIFDGWMTPSRIEAHTRLMQQLKPRDVNSFSTSKNISKKTKEEKQRTVIARINTFIEPVAKAPPRQKGFGE